MESINKIIDFMVMSNIELTLILILLIIVNIINKINRIETYDSERVKYLERLEKSFYKHKKTMEDLNKTGVKNGTKNKRKV